MPLMQNLQATALNLSLDLQIKVAEVMELADSLWSDNAAMKVVNDLLLGQLSDCHGRLQKPHAVQGMRLILEAIVS